MSRESDLSEELVFTGPVTQEELILTWKKRRHERERAEAEALKLREENLTDTIVERDDVTSRTEPVRILEVDPALLPACHEVLAEEPDELAPPVKPPSKSILRPAKLLVDSNSLNTDWVKRINMRKLDKPKRPAYVQPTQ